MHFNLYLTLTITIRTYSIIFSFNIKTKSSWRISSRFGFRFFCKLITYQREYARICYRIRSRCSSNRALIYINNFIYIINSLNFFTFNITLVIFKRSLFTTDEYNTLLISDDFPDPDTPVTHVRRPIGTLISIFFKLLA